MNKTNLKNIANIANDFGPPLIKQNNECFEILLPKYFRDKGWTNDIGYLQEIINKCSKVDKSLQYKVLLDFSFCRWIDPFPLMSILLEISFARHLGLTVMIRLPEYDDNVCIIEKKTYQESPNRLLYFLKQEGFLDCLDNLNDDGIQFLNKPEEGWLVYQNLHVTPSYEESRCIPMHLFFVPKLGEDNEFAKMSVENLLIGIYSNLDSKVAPQTRERLVYKLRVALQEVLQNTVEHAYMENNNYRPVVIYVRYRTGGKGLNSSRKSIIEESIIEESKNCPLVHNDWLIARPGCIEMFVIDRGIGIVKSFENSGNKLTNTHKFKEVLHKTFCDGESTKKDHQTRYGGLHLLHNLLADTSDYFRAFEGNIWFGCGVPFPRITEPTHYLFDTQNKMQGLAMHLRLGWKQETDIGSKWVKFTQGTQCEVFQELIFDETECDSSFKWFAKQTILDERFENLKTYGEKGEWILWLVHPHRMKNDILNFIETKIAPLSNPNSILIIADIPSYEAETYAAALSEFKASGFIDWPLKFSHIILDTNRCRFAVVQYTKYRLRHGFTSLKKDFNKLEMPHPPIKPSPKNFRLAIVRWLKWHDSCLIWEEVEKNKQLFIAETVFWGNDKNNNEINIKGFLDFPQTTHNGTCLAIYKAVLARVLGVLPPDEYKLIPLDRLTAPILREIYSTEIYESNVNLTKISIAIGSVLVSGSTLEASPTMSLDLHFFIHYSSPIHGKKSSLLFWLPKIDMSDNISNLARIGRSAMIAPEGWKSFEVPRFDVQGSCIGARNPKETYQDWQSLSPVIFKAGHWAYEGHHDFLTVNIVDAVDAAFLGKTELARFLISNILPFIGLNKTHLDENWHRLLDKPNESSNKIQIKADYGLLVYRSHPSSDSIIRKLLEILTPEGRKIAISRIYPILPVRMRWSGSTFLIPPLIREDIRKELNLGAISRPILIFDDAAITGRTLQDIISILSTIGATQVNSIIIANRLRRPAEGLLNEKLKYFWRLDVPIMGREGNCPLCHALDLAESFSLLLAATNAKKEINRWKNIWGEISPLDNWSAGLKPFPLEKPEIEKKFCYRQNKKNVTSDEEKYLASIDMIRSTGLNIHVSEMHAMTGRDDYCLKKIKEHTEPEVNVELASSQILLFGNEFDIDIRIEIIQVLIQALINLKEDSRHAPLAGLAILYGLELLEDNESKIKAINKFNESNWVPTSNYVIKVLLAFLTSHRLIAENSDSYKIGKSLLSTSTWDLAERLNHWYLKIFSPRGYAHSGAIPSLVIELKKSTSIKDSLIYEAMDSLDFLSDIISGLGREYTRGEEYDMYLNKSEKIKDVTLQVQKLLSEGISENKIDNWRSKAKDALDIYISAVKSSADAFFFRITSIENYNSSMTFETDILNKMVYRINWRTACESKEVNQNDRTIIISGSGKINFDNKAEEVWIVWHRFIYEIVLNSLRNAVYANGKIRDPWYHGNDQEADLWIRVDYEQKSLELTLANASKDKIQKIDEKLKKDRWSYLNDLGGKIELIQIDLDVVGIKINIPYAGYLDYQKGEDNVL